MRAAIVLLAIGAAGTAGASGSVALELADDLCVFSVEQTFRKILAHDDNGDYETDVRKAFAKHAIKVLPAVSRALKGAGVEPFDVTLPVIYCQEVACPEVDAEDASFPAIVKLAAIRFGDDARRQYVVGVVYARRPKPSQVVALHAKLVAAIRPHKDAESDEAAPVGPLGNLELAAPAFLVRVRPYLWVREELRARHEKRVAAMGAAVQTKVAAIFAALPAGLEAAPCSDAVPYYEEKKKPKLPGRFTETYDGGYDWRNVTYCLKKLGGAEALPELEKRITGALEHPF